MTPFWVSAKETPTGLPRRARFVAVLSAGMAFFLSACSRSQEAAERYPSRIEELAVAAERRDPQIAARKRGEKIYQHYCSRCHGEEGDGNGFNATLLEVPPRDFTDPQFRRPVTEEHLRRVIREGGPAVGKSVLMPAWGRTLSEQQIADVAVFLMALEPPSDEADETAE